MEIKANQEGQENFSKYNGEETTLRKAQLRLLDMLVVFDDICKKHDIPYFISGGTCLGAIRHRGFIPWDDDIDIDVWHTDYQRLKVILPKELPSYYVMQTVETDKTFYRLFMKIVDMNSKVIYPENTHREKLLNQGLSVDIFPLNKTLSYYLKFQFDRVYATPFKLIRVHGTSLPLLVLSYFLFPLSLIMKPFIELLNKFAPKEKISHALGTKMTPKLCYSECFPPKEILFEGKIFLGPAKPHEYLLSLYGESYMLIPHESKRAVHALRIEIQ